MDRDERGVVGYRKEVPCGYAGNAHQEAAAQAECPHCGSTKLIRDVTIAEKTAWVEPESELQVK